MRCMRWGQMTKIQAVKPVSRWFFCWVQFVNLSIIYIYIDGVSWNLDTVIREIWKLHLPFFSRHIFRKTHRFFLWNPPSFGDLRVANRNHTKNLRREHAFPAVALIGLTAAWSIKKVVNPYLVGGFDHFYFHPYLGKWSNLTNIFQTGWNHQLVMNPYWSRVPEVAGAASEYEPPL